MALAGGVSVVSWDTCFEVCWEDPSLSDAVGDALPPGSASTPALDAASEATPRFVIGRDGGLTLDGAIIGRLPREPSRLVLRLSAVLRDHVAQHAPTVVFVHAGVVGTPAGAIVMPGRSHSGKTTLVRALLRQGARYFSDEFAVVDRDGCVHPFPKPLSVRTAERPRHGVLVPVLPSQTSDAPARPALVLLTRYRPGAVWDPRPLSGGAATLAILDNTVTARLHPRAAMRAAARLAAASSAMQGPRGEAGEVAPQILSMLAEPRAHAIRTDDAVL